LSDDDAAANLTVTATAEHGTVAPASSTGTVGAINTQFASGGVVYTPTSYDDGVQLNDIVTVTVTDDHGLSDALHFVFQQSGSGGTTLTGTAGKDIIFSTGNDDTLTGLAGRDNFVFGQTFGHDTITDYTSGQDHIALNSTAPFTLNDENSFQSWATSSGHVVQQGSDTLITFDTADTILLKDVNAANLHASDFIVHA